MSAFAEQRPSALPTLKTVVTTPLVAPDGRIVAKQGFDRASGVYFDISPGEFAAIPRRPITDDDIKAAYVLLTEEMLCEWRPTRTVSPRPSPCCAP